MRGRKPLPTIEKIARGNPGKRPLNANEPDAVPGLPDCPPHLSDEATAEWHRMGSQLEAEGRVALVYKGVFAAYCQAWGRWVEAEEKLKEYGTVIQQQGMLVRSPYLGISEKAWAQMMKAIAELGISPTSQARVSVVHALAAASEDPYLSVLKGGKSA